jgi:hypothetical protein
MFDEGGREKWLLLTVCPVGPLVPLSPVLPGFPGLPALPSAPGSPGSPGFPRGPCTENKINAKLVETDNVLILPLGLEVLKVRQVQADRWDLYFLTFQLVQEDQ